MAAALFASACGSTPTATPQAEGAADATANQAAAAEAEAATADDPEAAPAESIDENDAPGFVEDPLFFGEFASLGGEAIDLADYAGQDVVLWFWAPW